MKKHPRIIYVTVSGRYLRVKKSFIIQDTGTFFLIFKHRAITAWKVSKYGVFSGLHFPAFRLNTQRYGVSLHIQSKWGKIRTRKNFLFTTFFTQWILIDSMQCNCSRQSSVKRKTNRTFYRKNISSLTLTIVVHIYRINSLITIFVRDIHSHHSARKSRNLYGCFFIQNNTSNFSNFN